MLTNAYNGLGEPINVIVSGNSDSQVLSPEGFFNYALSLEFGTECLGQHLGAPFRIWILAEADAFIQVVTKLRILVMAMDSIIRQESIAKTSETNSTLFA